MSAWLCHSALKLTPEIFVKQPTSNSLNHSREGNALTQRRYIYLFNFITEYQSSFDCYPAPMRKKQVLLKKKMSKRHTIFSDLYI